MPRTAVPTNTKLRPRRRALQGPGCAYLRASASRALVRRQRSCRRSSASVHRRLLHLQREGTSGDWTRCYSNASLTGLHQALSQGVSLTGGPNFRHVGRYVRRTFPIIDDVLTTCAVLPAEARAAAAARAALGSWRGLVYPRCRSTSCIPLRVSRPGRSRCVRHGLPPREPGRHAAARRGCGNSDRCRQGPERTR